MWFSGMWSVFTNAQGRGVSCRMTTQEEIKDTERREQMEPEMGTIHEDEFLAYEEVRKSGETNMFNITTVAEISGLSKDTILIIMDRYEDLADKYLEDEEWKNQQ